MPLPCRLLIPALLIAALPVASAAEKRAFQIEDLYRIKGVQHLALSPDGAKLAFEVSSQDLKAATRNTQIWVLDVASGQSKQLTYSGKSDTAPQWSKDGKTLYFLSSRAGGSQLWALDASGGEARKVTSFETGVGAPKLTGNKVVFEASVFPEAMTDGAKQKEWGEKLENGPVQAHMADSLLYRHWTEWRDFQYTHLFTTTPEGKVEAITSGKQDYPAFWQSWDLSPDGKEVCVTTNTDAVAARSTNQDLFLISLEGDHTPQRITGDNPAADQEPKYSPDGRYIAYKLQTRPGHESDRFRLALYDRTAKTRKVLTEGIDNWVDAFQWSADGKALWFTVQEKGRWPLYRMDVATGKAVRMLEGQSVREFQVSADQKAVFLTKNRVGEPTEIWRYAFDTKELKRLSAFNQALADEVDFRPAEEQWVKGADGKDIHVFLVKPHGFDPAKKYPLIMNVHGGPQMMWSDTLRGDWQVYPGAGYIVAFPNPHGSTGYGQAFTDAISGDWDGKVQTDIDKVADHLAALPYVDKDRMGAMGWSWGGYAMMWLEGHTNRYKALAAMMGVYDLRSMHGATEELWFPEHDLTGTPWEKSAAYERMNPSSHVKAFKTPCLVITGERDYRVPYTQSLQFFTGLQEMGVPSRLIVFKNDGHWPDNLKSMPVYYNAHLEWFQKYLGGGAAPWKTEDMIRNIAFSDKK
ncbi:S9 family peptidase [Geothrix sp. PMB-07]|uniref:S9 family peptidase n=1 Tax=Geothrix sp. PMB-07 TaxID=3068640 RepID=UPI0027405F87|nr:S9 family peptidase [Geothrix sp. PMB-07]WLT32520.1 S9 family peptidase [Geothrix sp. PMB-07]